MLEFSKSRRILNDTKRENNGVIPITVPSTPKVRIRDVVKEMPGAVAKTGGGIANFFFGNLLELTGEGAKTGYGLGRYALSKEFRKKVQEDPSLLHQPDIKRLLALGAGSALELSVVGKGVKTAAKGIKAASKVAERVFTRQAMKEGAKIGVKYGTGFGAVEALKSNEDLEKAPLETLLGAVEGGTMGLLAGSLLTPALQGIGKYAKVPLGQIRKKVAEQGAKIPGTEVVKVSKAKMGKFAPSRVAEKFKGEAKVFMEKVEDSPEYLQSLEKLRGGRKITNLKSYTDALVEGKMPIEEMAKWKAETPVNTVLQKRAEITLVDLSQAIQREINPAKKAEMVINFSKGYAGYKNMGATFGRGLEARKTFFDEQKSLDLIAKAYQNISDKIKPKMTNQEISKILSQEEKKLGGAVNLRNIGAIAKDLYFGFQDYTAKAKLSGISTQIVNTVAGALSFAYRVGEKQVEAGLLLAAGKPREAYRASRYAFGTRVGLRSAISKFFTTFVEANPDIQKWESYQMKAIGGKIPKILRPLNPQRWVGAMDGFFRTIIIDSQLHQDSKVFASLTKNLKGLKGKAFQDAYVKTMSQIDDKTLQKAIDRGKEYAFAENPDKMLKVLLSLRKYTPVGKVMFPFVTTMYNMAKFHARRATPFEFMSRNFWQGVTGSDLGMANKMNLTRQEALSRVITGGMATWGLLEAIEYKEIELTGAFPKDQKEQQIWIEENKPAWSIKLGGKWYQYNRYQPVGLLLTNIALIQSLRKAAELKIEGKQEEFEDQVFHTIVSLGNAFQDMPMMSGLNSLFKAMDEPERFGKRFVQMNLQGLFPNILRDARNLTDPVMREMETFGDAVRNILPVYSQSLQPKISMFGRIRQYEENKIDRLIKSTKTDLSSEQTTFLKEVEYAPARAPIPKFIFRIKGNDETYEFKGDEKTQYLIEMGEAFKKAVDREIKNKSLYERLTPDQRKDRIEKVVSKYREPVKNKWKLTAYKRIRELTKKK